MMRSIFVTLAILCTFAIAAHSQVKPEPRVIEVSGSAERLVTPDVFIFKITVIERMDKKEKLTIEQQEASLRSELQKLGIDVAKDLTVYDISTAYNPRKRVRDVMGSKDYRLKVRDINSIAPLIMLIDSLNIGRLELIETEHSEITRLRRETKMDAMRAAKEKADYLLGSIGERAGKPVYVKEVAEESARPVYAYANLQSNTVRGRLNDSDSSSDDDSLSFTPIRIRYVMQAKFEIE